MRGRLVIAAVNPRAARAGLHTGMSLADGRAIVPGVAVQPADPDGDACALERLARWAMRFTPRVAPVGPAALFLDVTGCERLFGGEEALADLLREGLENFGLTARLALAGTLGAAWALAHHGADDELVVIPPGATVSEVEEALAELPVAALRLDPPETAAELASFGLGKIGALRALDPAALDKRFGPSLVCRLGQALGLVEEHVAYMHPSIPREARRAFVEPVSTAKGIRAAVNELLDDLCRLLKRTGEGVRRLRLIYCRVDGGQGSVAIGTSRPRRRQESLMALFAEQLQRIEPGFGIEEMALTADVVEESPGDVQGVLFQAVGPVAADYGSVDGGEDELAGLLDRLGNRFGFDCIARPVPRQSWLPERAVQRRWPMATPAGDAGARWPARCRRRPLRLLSPPEPVEAVVSAVSGGGPSACMRWRGISRRVRFADGPERLECEWWREHGPRRDYYLAEDDAGRRYWLFREGSRAPHWFLHGFFG